MNRFKKWFLSFVLTDRRQTPKENRKRVAQNLMMLTIVIFFVFIINFAVIIGTDSKFGVKLSELAKQVHQVEQLIPAKRGTIYDRNGVPIAEASTTYTVHAVIDKKHIDVDEKPLYVESKHFQAVADVFHDVLGIEKDYTISQLSQDGLVQVSFGVGGSNISYSNMRVITDALKEREIQGVHFTGSANRMYPNGAFASQFIGLAQQQENKDGSKSLIGTTGMEASLNSILAGQDGIVIYEKDRAGLPQLGTGQVKRQVKDGQDVYTTLSAPLQINLETAMDEFQSKANGVFASATLIHAKTGQILATTQRPSFNSDTKEGLDAEGFSWNNVLYQTNYEPGSTLKTITTASAIDAGVFDPNQAYFNNQIQIADAIIKDWDVNSGVSEGRYMTIANALPFSSNIGMTILQQKLGDARWLNYLEKFRFGLPARIGIGGEATGLLPADNIVTYAMSSFGQGISVTQLQMLRAFTAISNDGVMVQPQFIKRLYDPNTDTNRVATTEVMGNPVSKEATDQTLEYMVQVGTDPYFGTMFYPSAGGPLIRVNGYSIAVKSGTAEIANPDGGGYLTGENDYIHSVVAMLPAEDPEFIMYTTIQQPRERWSGLYWQNLINPILEEAMFIKDSLDTTDHSNETEVTAYKLPKLKGENPGDTADELRRHLLHPVILGNGNKISKVSAQEGTDLAPGHQILLLTNKFDTMPDLYGWTEENVKLFAEWTGIELEIKGTGRVVKQNQALGTTLSTVKKLTVTLGDD
ncbi:penicillin-binding protein PBP2X [Streptococcus sp. E29BA]|uniref:penicillin-binding protein PBP2X n=1 Tax=Streptococcus sp. E29BA TaxID=3278716 RepID=UPI00359CD034